MVFLIVNVKGAHGLKTEPDRPKSNRTETDFGQNTRLKTEPKWSGPGWSCLVRSLVRSGLTRHNCWFFRKTEPDRPDRGPKLRKMMDRGLKIKNMMDQGPDQNRFGLVQSVRIGPIFWFGLRSVLLTHSQHSHLAIRETLVDGEWIVELLAVKSVFQKYFSTQFSSPVSHRICFVDQFINRLSFEQQADLERNVSNEEIKSTVWDCGTNKSPGPDCFTFELFRRYWKFLEHEIVATVKEFFASCTFLPGCLFSGILINNSLTISHFFFVDDAIFVRIGIRPEEVDAATTTMSYLIFTTLFVHPGVKVGDGALNSPSSLSKRSHWLDIIREVTGLRTKEIVTRWVKAMHIKINVFAWRVRLDKLPNWLNLSLKGIDISTIVCPLCHASVEYDSHIFFLSYDSSIIEETYALVRARGY
uniref:RNA-directed DNA polymerase, eukaryota n=1 Tax=Tanacetum cinerariifolium TaxID=118510 RepID=A0A6L2NBK0_TANCI|nr:RNA-directed DNA polymerase, eukaryota [Tanacetum cinerariifolium]